MMGSLRNPAAFNNVIGFRPSQGRVPFDDSADLFFDQLGYETMGRSVRDTALLLSVQAGADRRAPLSIAEPGARFAAPLERDFEGTRLGWLGDLDGYLPMQDGILQMCQRARRFPQPRLRDRRSEPRLRPGAPLGMLAHLAPLAGGRPARRRACRSGEACPAEAGSALGGGERAAPGRRRGSRVGHPQRLVSRHRPAVRALRLPVAAQRAGISSPRKPPGRAASKAWQWTPTTAGWKWWFPAACPAARWPTCRRASMPRDCRWACKSSVRTRPTSRYCNWPTPTSGPAAGSSASRRAAGELKWPQARRRAWLSIRYCKRNR